MVFVVLDGIDASGKSTQAELLVEYLRGLGKSTLLRSHPNDDNFFGAKSRAYLHAEGRSAHAAAALFYLADVVRSILLYSWRRVDYVVFVRYLLGTAYLPEPLHKLTYLFFRRIVPSPACMLYVKVTAREAYRRTGARADLERFETLDELAKVDRKMRELVSLKGWSIVDGDAPVDVVQAQVRSALRV